MWRRSKAEPLEDEQFACAYCDQELLPGDPWFTAEFDQGDGDLTRWGDYFWFCNQEHAGLFLMERQLPAESSVLMDPGERSSRLMHALGAIGFGLLIAANIGFYVLGFVTWIRWIWR